MKGKSHEKQGISINMEYIKLMYNFEIISIQKKEITFQNLEFKYFLLNI